MPPQIHKAIEKGDYTEELLQKEKLTIFLVHKKFYWYIRTLAT